MEKPRKIILTQKKPQNLYGKSRLAIKKNSKKVNPSAVKFYRTILIALLVILILFFTWCVSKANARSSVEILAKQDQLNINILRRSTPNPPMYDLFYLCDFQIYNNPFELFIPFPEASK